MVLLKEKAVHNIELCTALELHDRLLFLVFFVYCIHIRFFFSNTGK